MEIAIYYFTGTGNSLKAARTCQEVFTQNNHAVTLDMNRFGEPMEEFQGLSRMHRLWNLRTGLPHGKYYNVR